MKEESSRKVRTAGKRLFVPKPLRWQSGRFALGSATGFPCADARNLANTCSCPREGVHYEPMFVQTKTKSRVAARAADAIDLIIEFVTLGEYGLEYPEPDSTESRKTLTTTSPDMSFAEGRRSVPQKHRRRRRLCRPGRSRVDLPGWGEQGGHDVVPGVQPGRRHSAEGHNGNRQTPDHRHRPTSSLPEALRPPRIRLSAV